MGKKQNNLMTRDEFRKAVFERDNYKCVICGKGNEDLDAHHIIERRLFDDGGYYIDNGATLCGEHHIEAEQTVLSCDKVRKACGIKDIILPSHLYPDQKYDKWGNPILPNSQRLMGDLFFDKSVQKILKSGNVLNLFTKYVKYPRTYHLPYSDSITKDDRILEDLSVFEDKEVVVSTKMDGSNITMYNDYIHSRSINASGGDQSWSWVKNFHASIAHDIPEGYRICGENLFCKHSIHYTNLKSYFMIFSVWNDKNECLSWDETREWAVLLSVPIVPVLYKGKWDYDLVKSFRSQVLEDDEMEGYVVRVCDRFHYKDFKNSVGKYVREDFNKMSHKKTVYFEKNILAKT